MQNYHPVANGNPEFVDSQAVHGPQHLQSSQRAQELRNKDGKETPAAIIALAEQTHFKNRTTTYALGYELIDQRNSDIQKRRANGSVRLAAQPTDCSQLQHEPLQPYPPTESAH